MLGEALSCWFSIPHDADVGKERKEGQIIEVYRCMEGGVIVTAGGGGGAPLHILLQDNDLRLT